MNCVLLYDWWWTLCDVEYEMHDVEGNINGVGKYMMIMLWYDM